MAQTRMLPKFMRLERAVGYRWRCRGCGFRIRRGARAVTVAGLYGPQRDDGIGARVIFHPRCVVPWTAEHAHEIPLAGADALDRARRPGARELVPQ